MGMRTYNPTNLCSFIPLAPPHPLIRRRNRGKRILEASDADYEKDDAFKTGKLASREFAPIY
jgi:hypothetical protein